MSTKAELKEQLKEAHSRIQDMLMGDDGQAWDEAQKYLNKYDPEIIKKLEHHYEKHGVPAQAMDHMFAPAEKAEDITKKFHKRPYSLTACLKISGCSVYVGTLDENNETCLFLHYDVFSEPLFFDGKEAKMLIAALQCMAP